MSRATTSVICGTCANKFIAQTADVNRGFGKFCSRSCSAKNGPGRKKHGQYKTPTYVAWMAMKSRCNNKGNVHYTMYGGRGIAVCDRWAASFEAFLADMGARPSKDHSLDRIDVDGAYAPDNCRWATRTQQQNNRRNTTLVEFRGTQVPASDAYRMGVAVVCYRTFVSRIKAGWSAESAMSVGVIQPNGIRMRNPSVMGSGTNVA